MNQAEKPKMIQVTIPDFSRGGPQVQPIQTVRF